MRTKPPILQLELCHTCQQRVNRGCSCSLSSHSSSVQITRSRLTRADPRRGQRQRAGQRWRRLHFNTPGLRGQDRSIVKGLRQMAAVRVEELVPQPQLFLTEGFPAHTRAHTHTHTLSVSNDWEHDWHRMETFLRGVH